MELALGLIETRGLIGAIEAADAMAKAANVKIVSKEKSTGALITIKIVGEVAAVKAAVDAGSAAAQRVGQLISSHVIPRPHDDIKPLIIESDKVILPDIKKKSKPVEKIDKIPPTESKKEEVKISHPVAPPIERKIKEKPVVKETPKPIVEQDKKEEIVVKESPEPTVELKKNEVIKKEVPAVEKKEEVKVSPPVAPQKVEKIKEKPVVKETPKPKVEPDKKEEIVVKETSKPAVETEKNKVIKKEIPAVEKKETNQIKGLDHLRKLREEAQSEMNLSEKSKQEPSADGAGKDIPGIEEMEKMNVHQLRRLARSIPAFPIKGRGVSIASRSTLLDYLKKL